MRNAAKTPAAQTGAAFQFTPARLILFSLALMVATALVAFNLAVVFRPQTASLSNAMERLAVRPIDPAPSIHAGPWGTLLTRDIELERPAGFLAGETRHPPVETWNFNGLNVDAVRALLAKDGLSPAQVTALLSSGSVINDSSGTILMPGGKFLESLDASARQRLYVGLAGKGINPYLDFPYIFPGRKIEAIYADPRLQPEDVARLKKLVYPNGGAVQLGDYEYLLNRIPTVERRVALARAVSGQPAVLAELVIRPDTDVDQLAAYWGAISNARFADIRSLMDALKRLPAGGNLGLFYLLPKFARERLYTYPPPPEPGAPAMDCHWTTFNFSNDTPDNRFDDPNFTMEHLRQHCRPIAAPSLYGDILLLVNDREEVKHSAVYLADDLVFTKNGNNYRQPWMIMHLRDLLATYPAAPPLKVVWMRNQPD